MRVKAFHNGNLKGWLKSKEQAKTKEFNMSNINLKEAPLSSEQLASKRSYLKKLLWLPLSALILGMALLIWLFILVPKAGMEAIIFFGFVLFATVLLQFIKNWDHNFSNDLHNYTYTELDINDIIDGRKIEEFLLFSKQSKVVKDYLRQINKLNRLPTHGEYNAAQALIEKEETCKKNQALINEIKALEGE